MIVPSCNYRMTLVHPDSPASFIVKARNSGLALSFYDERLPTMYCVRLIDKENPIPYDIRLKQSLCEKTEQTEELAQSDG